MIVGMLYDLSLLKRFVNAITNTIVFSSFYFYLYYYYYYYQLCFISYQAKCSGKTIESKRFLGFAFILNPKSTPYY